MTRNTSDIAPGQVVPGSHLRFPIAKLLTAAAETSW
jgi:hypothetical protein